MANASFLIFHNDGMVKLKLRPNQKISFGSGGRCDEGWSRQDYTFRYDAERGGIVRHDYSEGADCDGRHSSHERGFCPVANLRSREFRFSDCEYQPKVQSELFMMPTWQWSDGSQRDYSAEAMGY